MGSKNRDPPKNIFAEFFDWSSLTLCGAISLLFSVFLSITECSSKFKASIIMKFEGYGGSWGVMGPTLS